MTLSVLVLTTVLSASGDQVSQAPAARPPAEIADSARVVKTLPSVNFGGSPAGSKARTPFAKDLAERHRVAALRAAGVRPRGNVKIICGTTVVEQTPDLDAQIMMPTDRSAGAAARRIEPQACSAPSR